MDGFVPLRHPRRRVEDGSGLNGPGRVRSRPRRPPSSGVRTPRDHDVVLGDEAGQCVSIPKPQGAPHLVQDAVVPFEARADFLRGRSVCAARRRRESSAPLPGRLPGARVARRPGSPSRFGARSVSPVAGCLPAHFVTAPPTPSEPHCDWRYGRYVNLSPTPFARLGPAGRGEVLVISHSHFR